MNSYLSAADIDAMDAVTKQHFLNPRAIRHSKSLGDATGLHHLGVHLITVEPGAYSTEFHVHRHEEECIYVLSGTGLATLGGDTHTVSKGDFMGFAANGEAHDLYNDSDEMLVCLVIGQRLDQDVCDYPKQAKRLYRYGGHRDVVDIEVIKPVGHNQKANADRTTMRKTTKKRQ